jgi:hypothetical protein
MTATDTAMSGHTYEGIPQGMVDLPHRIIPRMQGALVHKHLSPQARVVALQLLPQDVRQHLLLPRMADEHVAHLPGGGVVGVALGDGGGSAAGGCCWRRAATACWLILRQQGSRICMGCKAQGVGQSEPRALGHLDLHGLATRCTPSNESAQCWMARRVILREGYCRSTRPASAPADTNAAARPALPIRLGGP